MFARVAGRALARAGVRDGDHVWLARTRVVPDGALASVADPSGRGALWRVRHDRDALALYDGGATRVARTGPWPDVLGVVVGILRKFDAPRVASVPVGSVSVEDDHTGQGHTGQGHTGQGHTEDGPGPA